MSRQKPLPCSGRPGRRGMGERRRPRRAWPPAQSGDRQSPPSGRRHRLPRPPSLRFPRLRLLCRELRASSGGHAISPWRGRLPLTGASCRVPRPVDADYYVTAVDLVSSTGSEKVKFGIRLREGLTLRHCQYLCHYDSPIWRCCGCSAGWPCSLALTAPRTPRSSSYVIRSPCSSVRSRRPGCPGLTGRSWPRWPGCCLAASSASCA